MNSIPAPLLLNDDWIVEYFEHDPGPYEATTAGQPVPALSAFRCSGGGVARLTRTFDVPPILDVCLRFDLHITAAPGVVRLSINGQRLAEVDGGAPFALDVTEVIMLEDNVIALQLDCAQGGAFGAVTLRAEPCGV